MPYWLGNLIRGVVIPIVIIVVVYAVLICGVNYAFVGVELADIERTRASVSAVDIRGSESVYAKAVEANQSIAKARYYDDWPIVGIAIPNAWRTVPFIDLKDD